MTDLSLLQALSRANGGALVRQIIEAVDSAASPDDLHLADFEDAIKTLEAVAARRDRGDRSGDLSENPEARTIRTICSLLSFLREQRRT